MPEEIYTKKGYQSLLLKTLGRSPQLRILDIFLDNSLFDFRKNEVRETLGMNKKTFDKYWKELERCGAVKVTRHVGRATMYHLDKGNDMVKQLIKLDMALARKTMQKAVEEYQKPIAVKHIADD